MGDSLNRLVKTFFRTAGYEIRRANHKSNWGWDAFDDMARLCRLAGPPDAARIVFRPLPPSYADPAVPSQRRRGLERRCLASSGNTS